MTTLPNPQNPLDAFVYPYSETWRPNMKQQKIGELGKPPKNLKYRERLLKPITLKQIENTTIDFVKKRQTQRTELMNLKAQKFDDILSDDIDKNQYEMRIKEQQAQLKRLENLFINGVFGGLFQKVKSNIENQFTEEFLRNDPDIRNFDQETEKVMDLVDNVNRLQIENETEMNNINRQTEEIKNEIKLLALDATTIDQIENLQEVNDLLNEELKLTIDMGKLNSEDPIDIETADDLRILEEEQRIEQEAQQKIKMRKRKLKVIRDDLKTPAQQKTEVLLIGKLNDIGDKIKTIKETYLTSQLTKDIIDIINRYEKGDLKNVKQPARLTKIQMKIDDFMEMQTLGEEGEEGPSSKASQATTLPKPQK